MEERYQIIEVEDIPLDWEYEGYYWCSDSKEPKVLSPGSTIGEGIFKLLPFIVEGNLYSSTHNVSISIRCIDGNYHIAKIDLNKLEKDKHSIQTYYTHRIKKYEQYKMVEAWKEVTDEQLDGLITVEPAWSAFFGFV